MSLPKHLSTAPISIISAAVLVSFSCCCLCLLPYTLPVCLPPTLGEAQQQNEMGGLSWLPWFVAQLGAYSVWFSKEASNTHPLGNWEWNTRMNANGLESIRLWVSTLCRQPLLLQHLVAFRIIFKAMFSGKSSNILPWRNALKTSTFFELQGSLCALPYRP